MNYSESMWSDSFSVSHYSQQSIEVPEGKSELQEMLAIYVAEDDLVDRQWEERPWFCEGWMPHCKGIRGLRGRSGCVY